MGRPRKRRWGGCLLVTLLAGPALIFSACNADTEPATKVSSASATLRASVDWDDGEDVAYWFEYRRAGTTSWTRDEVRDPGPLGGSGRGVVIEEPVSGLTAKRDV